MLAMAKADVNHWDKPDAGGIRMVSKTALASLPHRAAPPRASDDRRTEQERADAWERTEALSVVLAQPHRLGDRNVKLAESLGRFCQSQRLGDHCLGAGEDYARIVREARSAQGLPVAGLTPDDAAGQSFCEGLCTLSQCALFSARCPRARKELALMRLQTSNEVLIKIMPRLPLQMERLVVDKMDPSPRDGGVLVHGLVALSRLYGSLPRQWFENGA